jgi:hypothetical protein
MIIRYLRKSKILKITWLLMGIYFINISIDSIDPQPRYINENLNINDQESIAELVVETILGYKNIFKEYDDDDTKKNTKKKNNSQDILFSKVFVENHRDEFIVLRNKLQNFNILNGYKKIYSPPPNS